MGLVFWKDIRGWETFLHPVRFVVDVFLPGYFQYWPGGWTNPYDFSRSEAFRNEIRFQTELNTTAAQWNTFLFFCNVQN